ncbi:GNAT family N-acetyltransferase [Streptomyces scabiei]|uniref:GNAT family N-acetyltransferase n=1 Tax=Streptomyces scabiei TaxID=1930 RepID=UPI000AC531D9|nr:hypothetical protein [Streptomyces scabiei]
MATRIAYGPATDDASRKDDLPELVRIYNHYVTHSIITFDTQPVTVESRLQWFERFSESVRYGARTAPQPTWMRTLPLECELADQPSDHNRNGKLG